MDRNIVIKKVMSKLVSQDYDVVSDFVRNNLDNPEKVLKYFQAYKVRNKLTSLEKKNILNRLNQDGLDLKKDPWNKVIETLETNFKG